MTLPPYEKLGTFYLGRLHDPAIQEHRGELLLYDSRDLTTHAVCVGMTGSGKTGLCLALIEEAAIDGVPALVIDPKGDLGNLALTFPELKANDFRPWIDAGDAARKSLTVDAAAEATAALWQKGLAEWEQDGARIARLRAQAEITIYTPGSDAGTPLSVLRSFAAPAAEIRGDATVMRERTTAAASSLLGLIGIDADPLRSPEHILLATLLQDAWSQGQDLELAQLIERVQKPPFAKVGVFDLESFYPARERQGLAIALNNLLAAPGFASWLTGEPLDLQRLLYTPEGRPRVAVVSIAHLSDAERMFVVTLLLSELVTWMRRQSGTSSLRALLYMDEIFGYFPPTAMPPAKIPLLTLLKQARAYGLGVVLSTQNPADLDYKGLANAGTWFIGRLQTDRDKARMIDGLVSSGAGGWDKQTLEELMSNLGQRVFLMRNVHDDAPVLFRTRWALSYLKGPMTLQEIAQLKPTTGQGTRLEAGGLELQSPTVSAARKPVIPIGIEERWFGNGTQCSPGVLATARIHFVDARWGLDSWETQTYLAPLLDDGSGPDWSQARIVNPEQLAQFGPPGAQYAEVPAALLQQKNYPAWSKQLAEYLYQTASLQVFHSPLLKLTSAPGGTEGDFRAKMGFALRERRDAEIEKLRQKYAPRLTTLMDRIRTAQDRVERERAQASDQKRQTAISIGTTFLGALLGRKAMSAANIGRAGTAMRGAGRIVREQADVARAEDNVDVLEQRLMELESELEVEIGRLQGELDPAVIEVQTIAVRPRKSDTSVTSAILGWVASR